MQALPEALVNVLAQAAPKFKSTAPPGDDKFSTIGGWLLWGAVFLCVVGIILAGVRMLLGARHGEGGEHMTRLGWAMAGCVVIGSASAIATGLI